MSSGPVFFILSSPLYSIAKPAEKKKNYKMFVYLDNVNIFTNNYTLIPIIHRITNVLSPQIRNTPGWPETQYQSDNYFTEHEVYKTKLTVSKILKSSL